MKKTVVILSLCIYSLLPAAAQHKAKQKVEKMPDAVVNEAGIQQKMAEVIGTINPLNIIGTATATMAAETANRLISTAMSYLGARYRSGQSGPNGFDCSGFTTYVFKKLGITLKRSSRDQFTMGTAIDDVRDLRRGDLVFFGYGRNVNHVGIVTEADAEKGTFNFIHSSSSQGVTIDKYPQADYWRTHYISARRILP